MHDNKSCFRLSCRSDGTIRTCSLPLSGMLYQLNYVTRYGLFTRLSPPLKRQRNRVITWHFSQVRIHHESAITHDVRDSRRSRCLSLQTVSLVTLGYLTRLQLQCIPLYRCCSSVRLRGPVALLSGKPHHTLWVGVTQRTVSIHA